MQTGGSREGRPSGKSVHPGGKPVETVPATLSEHMHSRASALIEREFAALLRAMRYIAFKLGGGAIQYGSAPSFLEAHARIPGLPPVLLSFSIDTSRLMQALRTPDDIGSVIRIHKDLDRELRRIVHLMVPKSGRAKLRSMTDRIVCLRAAGLPETRLAAARTINAVRNALAHGEKECLDEADVEALLRALQVVLGDDYSQGTVHDLTTDPYGEWDYRTMNWKGKFCMLGCTAVALVASIENEFQKHTFRPRLPKILRFSQIQEATKEHTFLMFLNNSKDD
jgi:hypothetical protein